jgi:hypothetical protein
MTRAAFFRWYWRLEELLKREKKEERGEKREGRKGGKRETLIYCVQ